jgi:hypothetical protein
MSKTDGAGLRWETHHAAKALLACSVPQLQSDLEPVDVHLLGDEEGAGGRRRVFRVEFVLRVAMEETGLADTCADGV